MKKLIEFLKQVNERAVSDEFDRVIVIIADEGYGKSTLILEMMKIWSDIIDEDLDTQDYINRMVYTREEYKKALVEYPKKSVIPVPDAARVLYKKDAMVGEQKELEKDMLQSRIQENLVLLGFQDWDIIPTQLQKRRARNMIVIPRRGLIRGYSRESIDERYEEGEWPEADLKCGFPSLEGTDLWREYKRFDREKKLELMAVDNEEEEELTLEEIAEEVKQNIHDYVGEHAQNGTRYIDDDLIEVDYDVSQRDSKKIKKLVERDVELEAAEV
jgi:hypothetical protein